MIDDTINDETFKPASETRKKELHFKAKEQVNSREVYYNTMQKYAGSLLALMDPIPREFKGYIKANIPNGTGITFIGKRAMYVAKAMAEKTADIFEVKNPGGYADKQWGRKNLVGRLKSTYIKSQMEALAKVVVANNIIGKSSPDYVWPNINWTHLILVQNYNDNEDDRKALETMLPKFPAVMKIVSGVKPFGNWEMFADIIDKEIAAGKFKLL